MTHSVWLGYAIVVVAVVAVGVSIGLCVNFLIWPGEEGANHIKRRVLG